MEPLRIGEDLLVVFRAEHEVDPLVAFLEGLAGHPTVKPVALIEDALLDVTHPGAEAYLREVFGSLRALGIEPGEKLRELQTAILNHDPALTGFRKSIDNIDAALIHMLAERFRIVARLQVDPVPVTVVAVGPEAVPPLAGLLDVGGPWVHGRPGARAVLSSATQEGTSP